MNRRRLCNFEHTGTRPQHAYVITHFNHREYETPLGRLPDLLLSTASAGPVVDPELHPVLRALSRPLAVPRALLAFPVSRSDHAG